ncbi:carbohydrate ABC transporter permease [Tessaracoccus caeni]|uniref:carbohydrate ABC transporter permease n=1 Tax=Tessaracoccus caeni TaxID=3031239 RepID=UPI0023DAA876|nr:sugar ABC transporter permease [Tessaracoccus caeni]MDF1487519.1 sugar ABC transporter permease [Tessaracoccus caeni]
MRVRRSKNYFTFLLFAGPNIALILLFIYYPLIMNFRFSFLDWRLGSANARSVGLQNYIEFFTSSNGLQVWKVTIIFTVATVIGAMVLGLLMAVVLNKKLPGRTVARTALFSPYVLSGVGVGMVWSFIFDPRLGVMRFVFEFFGSKSPEWFNDPTWALVMVIIVYIWKNLGYAAVIFIAGLQSVPPELLEAADVDGASRRRTFFTIVMPLLSPTIFFLSITMVLNSMQAFDILRIMTPSGNGTNTIIFEIYLQSFGAYQRAGYAGAVSVILFLTLFAITAFQMRYVQRKVHYQ